MSEQRVVVAGLVAVVMFLVGGVVVLGAKGWIHRPGAPVDSSSSPTEVARVAATAPSVDPVVTSAPVVVATTAATTTTIATAAARSSVEGDATAGALVTSAPVADAERTIASLRPGFRRCYTSNLASDPTMSGNVVLAIKIDAAGNVQRVDKVSGAGLSSAVESCIVDKAKSATFAAPGGSGATLQIPVTFASSSRPATTGKVVDPFGGPLK